MQATAERNNRHKYIRAALNYNYTLCNMRQEGSLFPPSTLSLARIPQMTFSSPSMNNFFPEKSLFCRRFSGFCMSENFCVFSSTCYGFYFHDLVKFQVGRKLLKSILENSEANGSLLGKAYEY